MPSKSGHALHAGMMMQCMLADCPSAGCCTSRKHLMQSGNFRESADSPLRCTASPCDVLQGAEQIGLDGVFHSMSKGSKDWPIEHRWYGSEDVVDHWAHFLVSQ